MRQKIEHGAAQRSGTQRSEKKRGAVGHRRLARKISRHHDFVGCRAGWSIRWNTDDHSASPNLHYLPRSTSTEFAPAGDPTEYTISMSPSAMFSRKTSLGEQELQFTSSVRGPVHSSEISCLPFAANTRPSPALNFASAVCTFTVELDLVGSPQSLTKNVALSMPSGEVTIRTRTSPQSPHEPSIRHAASAA